MGIQPNIKVNEYTSFIVRLVLVFGLVFELPVVCYFMAKMGLVNHKWLIQNGRYGVLIIFIVAAILTPPDIISQFLLAIPLCFIYMLCILIAYLSHPKKK
jgi:sec-independent protein translocase protein TatC